MREIKFKYVYSNSKNIFTKVFTLEQIAENLHIDEISDSKLLKDYSIIDRFQCTGLKDINGIEISENDIVKWGQIENNIECWHRVAIVEMNPSLRFRILNYVDGKTLEYKKGDNYFFGFGNFIYTNTHEALEIIGNIYENKELLNAN